MKKKSTKVIKAKAALDAAEKALESAEVKYHQTANAFEKAEDNERKAYDVFWEAWEAHEKIVARNKRN